MIMPLTPEQSKIRQKILTLSYKNKLNHIPSAFSMVDYFFCFYKNFYNKDKDDIIISKNYGSIVYYLTLGNDIPEDKITSVITVNEISYFKNKILFTDDTLCNALGVAAGYALNNKDKRIIINMGDAALYNGLTYESFIFISRFNLNNIILFVDRNCRGVTMPTKYSDFDFESMIKNIGWEVYTCNGHNIDQINNIFNNLDIKTNKPKCFIFNTVKGYGIYDFSQDYKWHGKNINSEEYQKYIFELNERTIYF